MITFVGGKAYCVNNTDAYANQRFIVSEKLYNPNHQELVKHRQQTWDETKRIIEDYEHSLKTIYDKENCVNRLSEKVDRNSPFSACAIACVLSLAPKELCDQLYLEL